MNIFHVIIELKCEKMLNLLLVDYRFVFICDSSYIMYFELCTFYAQYMRFGKNSSAISFHIQKMYFAIC